MGEWETLMVYEAFSELKSDLIYCILKDISKYKHKYISVNI